MKLKNGKSIGYWTRQATTSTTICRPSSRLLPSVLLFRTLKIRRAAIIVNSKTRQGGLNGISSVKIAEKVRLLSKRCRNCVSSPHVPLISHYCVFRQNIRLFSLSLEHIYLYYMSSEQFYPLGWIFRRKIGYLGGQCKTQTADCRGVKCRLRVK